MSTKTNSKRFAVILFALMALVSLGCGGGGGDDAVATSTNTRAPSLEVSPADFQFDTVTDDNTVSPLEVSLKNTGSAALVVSEIALTGPDAGQFVLDATAGTDPCGSTAPEIAAGGSCNVVVEFVPLSTGSFNADLTIASNDAGSPYNLALQGNKEDINAIDVQINQIQACPRNPATVYVSVTDQSGFVISDLQASDFALAENGGSAAAPTTSGYVPSDGSASISVALVMDYSGSITMDENNVTDMENAAKNFVSQLGSGDQAEIIKYATEIEVTQPFTANVNLLNTAIESMPTDIGSNTALYDAIVQAVEDLSATSTIRRAIIVITDGQDRDGSGNQLSVNDQSDVIGDAIANGTPVFTVGLGDADYLDVDGLQAIADQTGGTYSDSTTSSNLANIYQQLADLLFTAQYVLTYSSGIADSASGTLEVTATYAGSISDSGTIDIPACP